jgi:hypothetical protein
MNAARRAGVRFIGLAGTGCDSMLRVGAAARLPAMVLLATVLPVPAADASQVLPQQLEFDVVREGAEPHPHDVWHDAGGRWVRLRTIARDGSVAEWALK